MKYPDSIMTKDMEHCYFCKRSPIEIHHIMNGSYRNKSTKYGLIVPLCRSHHTGSSEAVHQDRIISNKLKAEAQKRFEKRYGHEKWMEEFNKNYI